MKRSWIVVAGLLLVAGGLPAQDAVQRRGFSVRVVEPVNQDIVFGKTQLRAEVEIEDARLIDRVEFMVGDDVVFVDREAPFECFHDFGEESKSWIIRAVAWHKEEISVSDAVITRRLQFSEISRVNRVVLWISVTDRDGTLQTTLDREDFRVFEDDSEQRIIEFYPEDRPITLALLLDTSGSMQGSMEQVHEAAAAFVGTLRENDRAMIIDFDDSVFLIQDLTSDHDALRTSIESTEPFGATAIYDAMHAAYLRIGRMEGRKAIILLTDGQDSASRLGFKRLLEEAKAYDTQVYAIGLAGSEGVDRDVLRKFAEFTGGRAFFVKKASELAGVYERIAQELRTQYYMTYSSPNETWDGRWIKVRVESQRDDFRVRARRGYFAVR